MRDIAARLPTASHAAGHVPAADVKDLLAMLLEAAPKWCRAVQATQLVGGAAMAGRGTATAQRSAEEVTEVIQFDGKLHFKHVQALVQAASHRIEA